ncbi:LysR family transcriptional regulator [Kineococcus sp. SYSU DK004]|uniref:LysR family transcriptional regulator n=1 Tax=Kineococcus sp. SYSU DK004 TaxID=3383125 RepID=UPI003D7DCB98
MAVEVRHLRALLSVLEEGTFTDAAIALGTTQASVSRLVAALERELGTRVLQRTPRGAVATAAGARVAAHARRVLQEVEAITRLAAEDGDVPAEVRVGYAWAALGRHTTVLQRRWQERYPASALVFTQAGTGTAGLLEGLADVVVTRRPLDGHRFATAVIGTEARCAALPRDHPLARRRTVRLHDFHGAVVASDARTGTTTPDLWPPGTAPAATRDTRGVDEWLTLIAAGQAIGTTTAATTWQHRRPGVVYRPVVDAEPVPVRLGWWRDAEPAWAAALVRMAAELYAADGCPSQT